MAIPIPKHIIEKFRNMRFTARRPQPHVPIEELRRQVEADEKRVEEQERRLHELLHDEPE